MSDESQKVPDTFGVCKKCNETKVRNPSGKFHSGRDKKYVDASGKLWNGLCCPKCQSLKMRSHQKVKRSKLN